MAKEKSLEEKVVQLLHNHEEQSEQIRQQNQQMQLILQHLQLKSLMPPPLHQIIMTTMVIMLRLCD
ncbi:hypothetical protein CR513_37544, partial [Mucuna pruriens]